MSFICLFIAYYRISYQCIACYTAFSSMTFPPVRSRHRDGQHYSILSSCDLVIGWFGARSDRRPRQNQWNAQSCHLYTRTRSCLCILTLFIIVSTLFSPPYYITTVQSCMRVRPSPSRAIPTLAFLSVLLPLIYARLAEQASVAA
jgi:hypothetical protein